MKYILTLHDRKYEVEVELTEPILMEEFNACAPVTSGQIVKEGDVLVILEAMKMENEIMAPKGGTVTKVLVEKGANVETGAPLVFIK